MERMDRGRRKRRKCKKKRIGNKELKIKHETRERENTREESNG
jgi:hypothetical protein